MDVILNVYTKLDAMMARTKKFNREQTLILAMELFWQKGYSLTSLSDLVEHLGINRFSLYSTYGDKKSLYYESLQYYIDNYSLPALEKLLGTEAKYDDIFHYIAYFSKLQYSQTNGCFVQNAILELSLVDDQVNQKGQKLYTSILDAVQRVLIGAQEKNQISSDIDTLKVSRFLLVQMQGIRVMGKAKRYEVMEDAVQVVFEYLQSLKNVHLVQ